ncbi:RagB/SusD family nutrient uptake outer membrane protein [Albibacterium bauzanense]|nr:RagB/SusD family nutrient uptake outer membrane protein [Albibacterium bauzanense]
MNLSLIKTMIAAALITTAASCTDKLDLLPTNDVTADIVYSTPEGYKQALAKVYGAYALTGNTGPAGNKDIQGSIDEGNFTDFLRTYWYAQELSTDEAVLGWSDPGLPDFHNMNWSPTNPALTGLYYRSLFQITLANDFLRQATDAKISEHGITGSDADAIKAYRSEVRFLRAFQYWVLIDLYGTPAFVTENDVLGANLPQQIQRADLFTYIESELKAIETELLDPRTNEYGRADKAAAWALLARLYLNAEVYTGTAKYSEAITYSKKVIDAGYSLSSDYRHLFLADNHKNKNEFILTINYDGTRSQSYGGTSFITHAAVGGSMPAQSFGISGGWGGIRTTENLPKLFPDYSGTADKRAQFYQDGQNIEIKDISLFTDGFGVTKFRNVTQAGVAGSSLDFADIDFPLFRLPEMYLIYAEATLRGGAGGDKATAIAYINKMRERAYTNTSGNVSDINLDFILDERARELYWEGFRRTDLIRYKRFVENSYLWPWKGGSKNGQEVASYRTLFPIPSDDLTANPNLKQNTGYN